MKATTAATARAAVLRRAYIATTFFCMFMVVWILFVPSTAFQDYDIPALDKPRNIMMQRDKQYHFLPDELLSKYKGHKAVHVTHTLPAAIWAFIIPFQLHSGFRKTYRATHRFFGYVFLVVCCLMTVGFFIIMNRGLSFENFIHGNNGNNSTNGNNGNNSTNDNNKTATGSIFLHFLMLYFLFTAILAITKARNKQYQLHQKWFIRHVASGIWVSIQRVLIALLLPFLYRSDFMVQHSEIVQQHFFAKAAVTGQIIAFFVGEYSIKQLKLDHLENRAQGLKKN